MPCPSNGLSSDNEFFKQQLESRSDPEDQLGELTKSDIDEILAALGKPTTSPAGFYEGLLKQVRDAIARQPSRTYTARPEAVSSLLRASPKLQDSHCELAKEEIDEVLAGLDDSGRTPSSALLQRVQEAMSRQRRTSATV